MKSALLVIDLINGILKQAPDGQYANQDLVVNNTNALIVACREQAIPIYFIRLAFDNTYSQIPKHSKIFNMIREQGRFKLGSDDTQFVKKLDVTEQDNIINKAAVSPFYGNTLMVDLKHQQIEKLIFAGVATDNAINLGVREAHDAGFYTVIAKDACTAATEQTHQWALTLLEKIANNISEGSKSCSLIDEK